MAGLRPLPGSPQTPDATLPYSPRHLPQVPPRRRSAPPPVPRRNTLALAVGVLAALALIASVAGAFVAAGSVDDVDLTAAQAASGPSEADGDHPAQWDERVQHLVAFVEKERGLEFEHPVQVDFLTPEAFSTEIGDGYEELTDEDVEELQDALPMMRAVGLMEGDFDLLDTITELSQAAVAAFYDPEQKRVVVPTTEPTAADEVVLVHELTHALQDQHFDLDNLSPEEGDEGNEPDGEAEISGTAVDALVEGDAMRIEDAYLATLSPSEQEDYSDAQLGEVGDLEATLETLPSALIAIFQTPYTLDPGLVSMIAAEGGNEAVDRAFQAPPTSTTQLVDPRRYLDGEANSVLEPPAAPVGEPLEDGDFGALDAYLMLAERIDPLYALTVMDNWGQDSYVLYEDGDQLCFRIAVESATAGGLDELQSAFQEWASSAPAAANVEVLNETGSELLVQTCDPGPDAELPNDRAVDSLSVLSLRSSFAAEFMTLRRAEVDEAWDISDCYVRGVWDLISVNPDWQPDAPGQGEVVDILRDCGA